MEVYPKLFILVRESSGVKLFLVLRLSKHQLQYLISPSLSLMFPLCLLSASLNKIQSDTHFPLGD